MEVNRLQIDKDWIKATNNAKRIRSEAEIHISLKHPSIIELYHYFEDKNSVYFISEHCSNGEVFRYLKREGKFSEKDAKKWFR
jgi:serine/threonine protein kinase